MPFGMLSCYHLSLQRYTIFKLLRHAIAPGNDLTLLQFVPTIISKLLNLFACLMGLVGQGGFGSYPVVLNNWCQIR